MDQPSVLDPIAIIGIGCRLPGGSNDADSYWKMMMAGTDAVAEISQDRWDHRSYYDPEQGKPGKTYSKWAGLIDGFDQFDPAFFGITDREATFIDPQQRLLLEATWGALQDAGLQLDISKGDNTGVFVGISTSDYSNIQASDVGRSVVDPYSATGGSMSIAANRISYVMNFQGPSVAVDTACSSSLVAVHLACRALWNKECDKAVAAGVNCIISPHLFIAFSSMGMLSPQGRCKAFDASANGFVRGEGAGAIILKPLSAALADGDSIYAVIRSTAVNQDGRTTGMTLPSRASQQALVEEACRLAGVSPRNIQYVEAHGTGTAVGDPIETGALGSALGVGRKAGEKCLIGSVKTNIGHLEAGAGIAGIIKVALSLRHGVVPPNLHFKTPNPAIDFEALRLQVVQEATPLKKDGDHRPLACINSFGFGGTNAHAVLEAAPEQPAPSRANAHETPERDLLLPLSSRGGDAALTAVAKAFHSYLQSEEESVSLNDICAAASRRRTHFDQRLAVVGRTRAEMTASLEAFLNGEAAPSLNAGQPAKNTRLVFVFSGQGPQWWAMGRELLATEPVFRQTVQACHDELLKLGGWSLLEELQRPENESRMGETEFAQPAIFAIQVALAALWKSWGIRPEAVVGHSVGEVAAAHEAGVLDLPAAIRVIYHRGRCMEHAPERGKMIAAALTREEAEECIERFAGRVSLAAVNGPKMVSIAGDADLVDQLFKELEAQSLFVRQVPVNYAFHSAHMDPVQPELAESLAGLQPRDATLPIYSTVTGELAEGSQFDSEYWWQNVRQSVLFAPAIDALIATGRTHFLEISPHPVLSNSMTECLSMAEAEGLVLPSLRRQKPERATMLSTLGALHVHGHSVSWDTLYPEVSSAVRLPPYPWQRGHFWHEPAFSLRLRTHPQLNPLIKLPVPSLNPTWEAQLNKRVLTYLTDHRVGQHIIFPGAGYIEMALAAGAELFAEKPLVIEELDIQRGCLLPAGEDVTTIQIACQPADSTFVIQSTVAQDPPSWVQHVNGRMRTEPVRQAPPSFSIAAIKARCPLEMDPTAFYQTAARIELHYGPHFQGVKHTWANPDEALARIEVSAAVEAEMERYLVHPALLDACIQTTIAIPGEGLYLPSRIERIRLYSRPSAAVWAYVRKTEFIPGKITVGDLFVLDDEGRVLMELTGFLCKFTEMGALPGSGSQADWLYTPQWQLKPLQAARHERCPGDYLPANSELAARLQKSAGEFSTKAGLNQRFNQWEQPLNQLCQSYIVEAFKRLGLKLNPGLEINLPALIKRGKINPNREKLMHRLLMLLERAELLEALPTDKNSWRVIAKPPTTNTTKIWRSLVAGFPSFHPELILLERCANALPDVLRGVVNAPELISANMLEHFQASSIFTRVYNRIVGDTIAQVVSSLPEGRKARILEIGAATGGVTASILPHLPSEGVDYYYTDTSNRFFDQAEQKFAGYSFVTYQILDLDLAPQDQGFETGLFDVIVLSNALSRTRDVQKALVHLKQMLESEALVIVLETDRPSAWHDLVLGMDERWWQIDDVALRSNYPLLPAADWKRLLSATGFSTVETVVDPDNTSQTGQVVLLARGPEIAPIAPPTPPENSAAPGSWLIFADALGLADSVADLLRQRGETCVIVKPADDYAKTSATEVQIRPSSADDYLELLSPESRPENLRGVVHLWSLDAPSGWDISTDELIEAETLVSHSSLYLVKALSSAQLPAWPGVWFITRGSQPVGLRQDGIAMAQTPLNGLVRVMMNEHADLHCRSIDLDSKPGAQDARIIVDELLHPDDEEEIAHRSEARYAHRLTRGSLDELVHSAQNVLKQDQCVRLESSKPGSLDKLVFRTKQRRAPDRGEVEIEVCAAALNFRDVMKALGIYPAEAADAMLLGDECAGRITRVGEGVSQFKPGDEVMALAAGSFGTYVTTVAYAVLPKPSHLTMEEAATMMVTYLTASYALTHQGRMAKGERVLIHAATGGVGQAAVRIALATGAEIFATAGSEEKRSFLKQIGVPHVLDSRTVAFAEEIMRITKGEGIDLVLNSLAGEAIHQSLSVLRQYGRFLEIGKRDIYGNTKVGLFPFRKNLSYHAIDLGHAIDPKNSKGIMQTLKKLFGSKKLPPLPYRAFPLSDAGHAFRYITQARQIGKVVLSVDQGAFDVTSDTPKADLHLDGNATYLVAGGLGGFGLALAVWLVEKGARHIVVTGRSGASTDEAREGVATMEAAGAAVTVLKSDVSNPEQVAAMLTEIRDTLPPLRGVFHVAMVLDDGLISQLDADRFRKVTTPKINGAWNLHQQTRDLTLDHFVMFSSVSSIIGSPGQANYAAANAFLDALAHHRRLRGLPALTVNWGVMAGVGYVARHKKLEEHFERIGWAGLTPSETLPILGRLLQQPAISQMMVSRIDWARWAGVTPRLITTPRYAQLTTEDALKQNKSTDANWLRDAVLSATPDEQSVIVETFLREQVAKVLRTSVAKIDPKRPLNELGLDSLMAVELIHQIESLTGLVVPTAQLMGGAPTVQKLSAILLNSITGGKAESLSYTAPESLASSPANFIKDANLARAGIHFASGSVETSQIRDPKNVFLTGALDYLGAYLLRNLLQETKAAIHCLVDAAAPAAAIGKIRQHLIDHSCWDESFVSRIVPVIGDIQNPLFGLSRESFDNLAQTVDAVYHTTALINHIYSYDQLKPVNVDGVVEIIRLAGEQRLKPVHYLSSVSVLAARNATAEHDVFEDSNLNACEHLNVGYSQCRWVAEQLFLRARDQGLPVNIYRPGLMSGDDKTGISPVEDFIWRYLKACIELKAAPLSSYTTLLTPVDYVASAMVQLSKRMTAKGKNYHLTGDRSIDYGALVQMTVACGYDMQIIPPTEWEKLLTGQKLALKDNPLAAYMLFTPQETSSYLLETQTSAFTKNTQQDLRDSGVVSTPIDLARMRLYLDYFVRIGFLPPPSRPRDSEPSSLLLSQTV